MFWWYLPQFFFEWNVSDNFREIQNTHFMVDKISFLKSCRLWDNIKKYGTAGHITVDKIIWCMRITWWISKATYTHSEYTTLITFLMQQCLYEHSSILRCTYVGCLSCIITLKLLPKFQVPIFVVWWANCSCGNTDMDTADRQTNTHTHTHTHTLSHRRFIFLHGTTFPPAITHTVGRLWFYTANLFTPHNPYPFWTPFMAGLHNSRWMRVRPVTHLRRLFIGWCRRHPFSTKD